MELNELKKRFREYQAKMHAYEHATGLIYYDSVTTAPPGSSEQAGITLGALSEEIYKLVSSPELETMIAQLLERKNELDFITLREAEELDEQLRKMRLISMEEYVAYTMLLNEAQHVWHKAKASNDFAMFLPCLERVFETLKRFAGYYNPDKAPYDVWLNEFEKGLTQDIADSYFNTIKAVLVPLIHRIAAEGRPIDDSFLNKDYPLDKQRELSAYLMKVLTINPDFCAIGETEHPFTTHFSKHDVRITTHYNTNMLGSNMYSVIHEGGHALYELHTGDDLIGSVLANGTSMGVHESQSRFYENIIGRSLEFVEYIFPKLKELFPEQLNNVTAHDFYLAVNKSVPSLIRTEADELTYSLHVLIRYELEKQLMSGELAVKDLPEAWNRLYEEYLGVKVPDDARGVLQDSHWSGGLVGYFPSYSIGSAYAAQMLDSLKKDVDVWDCVYKGELAPIVEWFTERIYRHGTAITPVEAIEKCCGKPFDPSYYTEYLVNKFSAIYGLN